MGRVFILSGFCLLLSACAGGPDWSRLLQAKTVEPAAPEQFNFAWRLSGDRAVAPLQVFDNGRRMWLQFASRQAMPAVFERLSTGDRPVAYTREGPYMVLQGLRPSLVLRGGRLSSYIERIESIAAAVAQTDAEPLSGAAAPNTPAVSMHASVPSSAQSQPDTIATLTAVSFSTTAQDPPIRYSITPNDVNLRTTLSRWAQQAGWTFEPEHWAVNADIPIAGSADFEPGFKSAVQQLMASTELADRPLQPCFYSNRVLRIVPYAQPCDRTAGTVESS